MTTKELMKVQKNLDTLIEKQAIKCGLSNDDLQPIYDGIADESAYLDSRVKVAWIMKEPYDDFDSNGMQCGGGWSLVKDCLLNHDENWVQTLADGTVRRQWKNPIFQRLTYVMYGFRHGKMWDEMEWIRDYPSMMDEIKSIAWINLSKMPALTASSNGRYKAAFSECWKDVVLKQIDSYDPDILIFGGTFDSFKEVTQFDFTQDKIGQNDWAAHYRMGKRHCLDTYHPGRKGGAYVDALIKSLNAVAKQIARERD